MRFVSVRDLRSRPAEVWREIADDQDLVLTHNGRPIAILSPVSDDRVEETLAALRRLRAADAVMRMQTEAARSRMDRISPAGIDAEIAASRREHRKRRA